MMQKLAFKVDMVFKPSGKNGREYLNQKDSIDPTYIYKYLNKKPQSFLIGTIYSLAAVYSLR